MAVLQVPPIDLSYPTLGPALCDFIEERFIFGPGSLAGQPARLDNEKRGIIYRLYEIQPRGHTLAGRRRFERGAVELRKGVAKTELAAWICGVELHPESPVRCDGFDAYGNPVGRPVRSPVIPMMAVTEEQVSELAFGVLKYILENCADADLFDISKERIVRLAPNGAEDGFAVAVSNAPGSRDGARTSFQHFDEPHRLYLPRQRDAHETMLQNMPKRPLEDPWTLYTSTAGQPGQNSIEEDVHAEAQDIADGKIDDPSLFFFGRWAGDKHNDLSTVENRVAAVSEATGPVGEFGPGQFERIAKDYDRKGVDKAYWERVYLNRWRKSNAGAYDMSKVNDLVVDEIIPKGAFITVGFDGARRKDATAIVITEIDTGRQQIAGLWERPDDVEEWEVDEQDVDNVMHQVFKDYEVWRDYCDPPYWTETVAKWSGKWPEQVVEWWCNRQRAAAYMARAYREAIDDGAITFVGTEERREQLVRHIRNAGRKDLNITDDEGQPLWILQKLNGQLQNKFDACMAGNLSWQARLDAVTAGARPKGKFGAPRRLY